MSAVSPPDAPTPHRDPYSPSPRHSGSMLTSVVQVLIIMLLLAILAGVVIVFFALASLANMPAQVAGGVGQQLGGVVAQAGRAAGGMQTAVQNATDPNHPPTGLTYDTEFTALQLWHAGAVLPDANQHAVTLQSIQRRQNADSAETALYAVIHTELRQPRETRLFGQVIHTDSDPHDYVLYTGESFRLDGAMYRVNWISEEERVMAVGTYRNPDGATAPLKFDVD